MPDNTHLGIIALVPDAWNSIVMPRHQVLRRLAQYFPVVWVEPALNWREHMKPFGRHFLARDQLVELETGMDVLTTGWSHPNFNRPRWLERASFRSRLETARRRLIQKGATRIGLYIWRDEFGHALDLVKHDFSCYHVDDEYNFSEVEQPTSERELMVLRRVDQVIVHSPALFRKKGMINPRTVLIPNGVDFARFATPHPEPVDLQSIAHRRIGYIGVIKKQLDISLLVRLSVARPHCSFVLVGPVMNVSGKELQLAELRSRPNVHFLGSKTVNELPSYIQHMDVCLMCYEVNDYTRYIYPLKLNEYLATGRPTISSPIETVCEFGNVVSIAHTDDEWLHAIDNCLTETARGSAASDARQAVARANDWDQLVERIAAVFRSSPAQKHEDFLANPVQRAQMQQRPIT